MSTLCIFDLDCPGPQTVVITPSGGAPITVEISGPGGCASATIPAAPGTFFSAVLTSETVPVCFEGGIVGTTSVLGIFREVKCGVETCVLAEPIPRPCGPCGPTVILVPIIVKDPKHCPPPPCPPKPVKPCKDKEVRKHCEPCKDKEVFFPPCGKVW